MSHQYADLENLLSDYLPEATKQIEKDAVSRILTNVSAFVDSYCRRTRGYFLGVETTVDDAPVLPEATEKRICGEGHNFLRLPVHVFDSIESVSWTGSDLDESLYYESDKNGWIYYDNQNYLPESSFDYVSYCRFHDGAIYKVRAVWGYVATPLEIVEFCRLATKSIWETQNGVLGQISPVGFALKAQMFPPDLLLLIENYKRREFEI